MPGILIILAGLLVPLTDPVGKPHPEEGANRQSTKPPSFWLECASEQIAAVEDPRAKAALLCRSAMVYARLGDEANYRRSFAQAEAALAIASEKPARSPVDAVRDQAFRALIRAKARVGDIASARKLVEGQPVSEEHLLLSYYGNIASAQVESGDVDGAIATVEAAGESDQPAIFQVIAWDLARKGDYDQAQRALRMIPGLGEHADVGSASRLAEVGLFDEALDLVGKIPSLAEKQDSLVQIAEEQAKAGDDDAALETAASVPLSERRNGFNAQAPEYKRDLAYASIARVQLGKGDFASAKATASHVEGELKPHVLRDIVRAEVESGKLDDARQTAESMPGGFEPIAEDLGGGVRIAVQPAFGPGPRAQAFETLALAEARAGLLDRAIEHADASKYPADTLPEIALIAIELGREEHARRIIDRLKRAMEMPSDPAAWGPEKLFQKLAIAEYKLGDPSPYRDWVAELEDRIRQRGDGREQEMAQVMLLSLHLGIGRFEEAREIVRSMREDTTGPLIAWLAAGELQAGDMRRAEALASVLPPTAASRPDLISAVAVARSTASDEAEVIEWVELLPTPSDRAAAYLGVAGANVEDGLR